MSIGCDDWSFSFKKECDKVAYQCIFCLQSKLKLVHNSNIYDNGHKCIL